MTQDWASEGRRPDGDSGGGGDASHFAINDAQSAVALARSGFGLTRVLSYQAGAGLGDGSLVRVLKPWEPPPLPVHLVYPAGSRMPARTRAFLDFATEALRARAASRWVV